MNITPVFLVIHPKKESSEIFTTSLGHEYGSEVHQASNIVAGIKIIERLEGLLDGIITINSNDGEQTAKELFEFLDQNAPQVPVVVLGKFSCETFDIAHISLDNHFDILDVFSFFNQSILLQDEKSPPEYVAIPIHYFFTMGAVFCDVFLKISLKGKQDKFLKRMFAGDTFEKADILRYQDKFNVTEFYIPESERTFFINNLIKQTITILEDSSMNKEQRSEATSDAFEVTRDLIIAEGFTEEVNKVVLATMSSMKEILKKNKNVAKLLKETLLKEESYSYKRTHLLINLAVRSLKFLPWATENIDVESETVRKIIYFSFFHDIYLKEESSHRIHSQKELNFVNPSIIEKENILEHASKAAALIREFPLIPMGVDGLIANHHGVRTGMGFATNYSSNLPPLIILLIVVEDYVVRMLASDRGDKTSEDILSELRTRHLKPAYQKILKALEEALSVKE